jgi:hypothetical protein
VAGGSGNTRRRGLPVVDQLVAVPVCPLTELLLETVASPDFDLLSLDVDGLEVDVLRGLDLEYFLLQAVFVKVHHGNLAAVQRLLEEHYEQPAFLTNHASYSDCFFILKIRAF